MIAGLLQFLIGAVVIIVVLAVVHLVMQRIPMDAGVKQIVWLVVGLLALVALIVLVAHAFGVAV